MEALLLAGGRGERLGEAARGRPKPLVPVMGRPLAAYAVGRLVEAGVARVIVSCAAGAEPAFESELGGLGAEIAAVGEPEPLGRGGGLRLAAAARSERGPVYALNGDELLDVDLQALLAFHQERAGAATIVVAPMPSAFGMVEVDQNDAITAFHEAAPLPHWANAGLYVLGEDALDRLPEQGDHEKSTFPGLAREGRLFAFRHHGVWLTVNTPKDLRLVEDFLAKHPDWLPSRLQRVR